MKGELPHGGGPFDRPALAHAGVLDGEAEQLQGGLVVGEAAARLDDLAQASAPRLDGAGGVDHLANGGGEREERRDLLPGPAPDLVDGRVAPSAVVAFANKLGRIAWAVLRGQERFAAQMTMAA